MRSYKKQLTQLSEAELNVDYVIVDVKAEGQALVAIFNEIPEWAPVLKSKEKFNLGSEWSPTYEDEDSHYIKTRDGSKEEYLRKLAEKLHVLLIKSSALNNFNIENFCKTNGFEFIEQIGEAGPNLDTIDHAAFVIAEKGTEEEFQSLATLAENLEAEVKKELGSTYAYSHEIQDLEVFVQVDFNNDPQEIGTLILITDGKSWEVYEPDNSNSISFNSKQEALRFMNNFIQQY